MKIYNPEDYQPVDSYETACNQAQELANKIKRQAVVVKKYGHYVVYGRKEYYNSLPATPRDRAKKNRIVEFIYPE